MARREDISNTIWADSDFLDLSASAKLVYLWSFTNPRCGMAGIYRVGESVIAFETKLSVARVSSALAELARSRFAFYEDGVLFVRTRVRHLRQKTNPIAKSIANDLKTIPERHPLRAQFLREYSDSIWLKDAVFGDPHLTVIRGSHEGRSTFYGTGTGKGTGTTG